MSYGITNSASQAEGHGFESRLPLLKDPWWLNKWPSRYFYVVIFLKECLVERALSLPMQYIFLNIFYSECILLMHLS